LKYKKVILLIVVLVISIVAMVYINTTAKDLESVNTPLGCAARWLDDVSTLGETVDCINFYMEKKNDTKPESGSYYN
jgi:competence protein ComGC